MKAMRAGLVLCAMILFVSSVAFAQLKAPEIAEKESGYQRIQYIESGEILYNIRWSSARLEKDGKTFIKVDTVGDNGKQGKNRIDWTEEAVMELTPKGPHTQYWKKTSTGAERMTWLLNYDWNAKKAQYSYSDAATGKKEDKTLAFGENAMPGDALSWVVRGFPFEKDAGFQIVGQIVMTDGSILEGLIIHRGQEKLQTEFGALETYKLELKPASRFIGAVAPKMYLWCTKAAPHLQLRFDGRDEGLTKPRTKNVLYKYEPKAYVVPKE